jgi:ERCC4-type nuclease
VIFVDTRAGSSGLISHLRHWGVPVEGSRLEYGDAAFGGNGSSGPVTVAIELKKVHDALSCMENGRFAGHQLPGLLQNYDRIWFVLEGTYRPDFSSGLLLMGGERRREIHHGARRFMYRDLDNWLTSMEVMANIRVRRVTDTVEAARFVADLYGWWQKDWSAHKSHKALYEPLPDMVQFTRPTLTRRFANQLPGVGDTKAQNVLRAFPSVGSMVRATEAEWAMVEGIGKTLAKRIYYAIHGGDF